MHRKICTGKPWMLRKLFAQIESLKHDGNPVTIGPDSKEQATSTRGQRCYLYFYWDIFAASLNDAPKALTLADYVAVFVIDDVHGVSPLKTAIDAVERLLDQHNGSVHP
jgi:hypothetical protein